MPGSAGLSGADLRYLRALQMMGEAPLHPWGIRGFGGVREGLRFEALQLRSLYQSSFPLHWDEGPAWVGKGANLALRAGAEGRVGSLSVRLAPVFWSAQNADFPLQSHPRTSTLPLANAREPGSIDFPQRLGEGALAGVALGDSEFRLEWGGLVLGASGAAIGWGPGEVFALLMSDRGAGYPHAFFGTGAPLDLRVATVHFRGAWGELKQSDHTSLEGEDARRFSSSLAATVTFHWLPGLEVGGGRFFHIPWRPGGPSLGDALRPFEELLKVNRTVRDSFVLVDGIDQNQTRDNQLATAWARWVIPEANFEFYGEFARDDHSWDLLDLLGEPEHNGAWMLGGAWAREAEEGFWLFRAETANSRINHLESIRGQAMLYVHGRMKQGHTHRGRILGTPAIYGGGGSYVGVDRYAPWGRAGVRWRRELRADRWARGNLTPDRSHDVVHTLSLDGRWTRGGIEWNGELTGGVNLNRYFESHEGVFRVGIGAAWRLP